MLEKIHLTPTIFVLYTLCQYAAFWHHRWAAARKNGVQGAWPIAGLVIDISGFLSVLFGWAVFAFVWWQRGFISAAALGLVGLGVSFIMIMATAPIMRGRNEAVLWISGALAFWPLAIGVFVSVRALPPVS